jgi:Transcriptional regulator containing PAS, AAA-type ATPase, and DNA-binding domains
VRHGLVYREPGHPITLRDLPPEVLDGLLADTVIPRIPAKAETGVGPDVTTVLEQNGWSLSRSLETLERMMIEAALNAAGGNQTKAASNLGITPRSIYNKLHRRS